ncbi:MAG: hypothetical protein OQL27_13255 [Sedimenticola sp.]|nr:hypothetical protein [Sedimenticola sp.]
MDITTPTVLKSLSTAGSAAKELTAWWKKSTGDSRALIGELKDNLIYLDIVAKDGVELGEVIDKLSVTEYKRLANAGFNFNSLKRGKLAILPSLKGTDLVSWQGKQTDELIESIYEKLNDLKLRYPHVKKNSKYRWSVRVNNIRKRIWLLLMHVRS